MKRLHRLWLGVLVLAAVSSADMSALAASDWRQFQRNAQHTGYNNEDSISPPLELRWEFQYNYADLVLNQITVAGDLAYATPWMSARYNPALAVLGAHDVQSGHTRWSRLFDDAECMSQPTCEDGIVYVQSPWASLASGFVSASGALDGDSLWTSGYRTQVSRPYAPAVDGGRVHIFGDTYGGVHTYDSVSGTLLWRTRLWPGWYTTPSAYQGVCYVFMGGNLDALDAVTGEWLWELFVPGGYVRSPAEGYDQRNVAVIDTLTSIIYCTANGALSAVDLTTRTILWQRIGGLFLVTPALADGVLYAQHAGTLTAYDALTGDSLWCFVPREPFGQQPVETYYPAVVANGHVYVSSAVRTYAISIETHQEVWSDTVAGFLSIAGGQLYVATAHNHIYAYGSLATDVVDTEEPPLPATITLYQNHPNPFNPETEIRFSLPRSESVRLEVFNLLGQSVATLIDGKLSPGEHRASWHADGYGSGIYLYRLTAGWHSETKKMMLLK